VGVIIGPDLVVRNGQVITDATKRSRQDRTVHGIKKMLKTDPEAAREAADRIIKNTYRTLMTRGLKGCYVFCTDAETNKFLRRAADRVLGEGAMHDWPRAAEPDTPHVDEEHPGGSRCAP